jgi:hypothetical protein
MEVDITKFRVYLMAFWCIFFMRLLMFGFGMFKFASFVNGVFIYSTSHPSCDGDEGVDFPPIVWYDVDCWVVFGLTCKYLYDWICPKNLDLGPWATVT